MSIRAAVQKDGQTVGTLVFDDNGFIFEVTDTYLRDYLERIQKEGIMELSDAGRDQGEEGFIKDCARYIKINITNRNDLYISLYNGGYDYGGPPV